MKTKKKGKTFIIIGLLMILAAFSLTGYNIWDNMRAAIASNEILAELYKAIENNKPEKHGAEMPELEIDGEFYVAVIQIPDLNLTLPVISSCSENNLRIAPCRYSGSIYTNDLVIAAHNYRSHFGQLDNLSEGAEITIVDFAGDSFTYKVAGVEVLQETAVEEMTSSGWDLSLFTCTIGGKARVTVRCDKITD